MTKQVPYLNIFLSSPGDVAEERAIARKIMKRLPNRPTFKGRVALNIIAWDDLDSSTAMEASLTPQAAINKGLPTPAESDIVIVIFWSRMGTPFTDEDGQEYQSGTHWELLNALSSKRTKTYIYRRMQKVSLDPDADDFHTRYEQYQRVKDFFNSEMFYKDGQIKMSVQQYDSPADFEEMLDRNFEQMINEVLEAIESKVISVHDQPSAPKPEIQVAETVEWDANRSPFPGLHAFTEQDADIFFGRGRETDALVQQVKDSRFVAVVGASGSGKSSLVGAGLVPRLRENAIVGSKDWHIVRFIPSNKIYLSLCDALIKQLPELSLMGLMQNPQTVVQQIEDVLFKHPEHVQVLLFIDQFEELFTLNTFEDAKLFAEILSHMANSKRVRAIATMRHDFYHRAVENPQLAELLRYGSFPLSIPKRDALRLMIERPAERAGLEFDDALVARILDDTGDEPGNLALMAYALDELYKLDDDKRLTHDEYEALGGVQGAIGTRAENQFKALNMDDSVIQQVFHALVEVDERGTATRRREQFQPDELPDDIRQLIEAFINARLLVSNVEEVPRPEGEGFRVRATIEVAHEAILRQWKRLADWIEATQDDHRTISRMKREARIWDERERPDFLLPNAEALGEFVEACDRLEVSISDDVLQDFTEPEQERLYRELESLPKDATSHERRRDIGDRLAVIGDTRAGVGVKWLPSPSEAVGRGAGGEGLIALPDMAWIPITEGGEIEINSTNFEVKPFYISKYQVTYIQYQAFAETDYDNPTWWEGFPENYRPQNLDGARTKIANAPRDSISWYQAVAFSRWLDAQYRELGLFDRLPALTLNPSPTGEGLEGRGLNQTSTGEGLENDYRVMADKVMVNIARELRQRQTPAEELLWECLRDRRLNNMKFRRQHPVANTAFVVDFFCHEYKLVVELDGAIHKTQQQEDQWRQSALEDLGLTVIRFSNEDVFNNLDRVLIEIQQATQFPFSQRGTSVREKGLGDEGLNPDEWQIRIPTEWEWQWLAQNGEETRDFPWGNWQEGYANTGEAGMNRTTAVGMYPHGKAVCEALDMAGNLYEWCLNDYNDSSIAVGFSNGERKVLRGGAFNSVRPSARSSYRNNHTPNNDYFNLGVRLVVAPILRL